jgi:hypothetical protein
VFFAEKLAMPSSFAPFSFLAAEKNEAAYVGGFAIILTPYGIVPNATR